MRPVAFVGVIVLAAAAAPLAAQYPSPTYSLRYDRGGFELLNNQDQPTTTVAFAPKGARFQLVKPDDGTYRYVSFTHVQQLPQDEIARRSAKLSFGISGVAASLVVERTSRMQNDSTGRTGAALVGPIYRIRVTQLTDQYYKPWWAWEFGALAIPAKLQLSDGRLTAGGTGAFYAAYHLGATNLVISAGIAALSSAAPAATPSTTATVDTRIGQSFAGGVVFDVGAGQLGILFGVDVGQSSKDYQYANKAWMSISIGAGIIKH